MNKLVSVIEGLRAKLPDLKRRGLKETPTRQILIDPLLEALGWDIRDPDEVEHEYTTIDGKSVDYALKLNRKPCLLVEAKPLADDLDDVKAAAQVVGYAANNGIVWCVLTNGAKWKVYRSVEQCEAPQKLMYEVSLDGTESAATSVESLADLIGRLARDEMAKGTLDALGERTFTDGKVRKVLDTLMRDPPRALLNLVRDELGNVRLEPRRIKESLHRIAQASSPVPSDGASNLGMSSVGSPRIHKASQRKVTPSTHHGRRSRSSKKTYDERHHTTGIPQEVIEIYRALERECLAMSPGLVEQQCLAKCIAYRSNARTFCSVHLQRAGLRVWLHLRYGDIDSPPRFARDVSNVGHWGGGDLELDITNLEQVSVAARLIRESFLARCGTKP